MFWNKKQANKKRIYLDYAAATPVRKEILSLMAPYFSEEFANAGAIHQEGAHAKQVISRARSRVAKILHIRPQGVLFTGSGTESNNIAIMGVIEARRKAGAAYADMEVISTAIEHPSVGEVLVHLKSLGVTVLYAPLSPEGLVEHKEFSTLLSVKTVLVCFTYVQSEIGVIQPVGKIAREVRQKQKQFRTRIHVHVDGAQAPLWHPCALDTLGCDSLSLDAGKCYGPKGVGVLAFVHGSHIAPVFFGGGQEGGLRSGTENVPLIVGATEALCIAQEYYRERSVKVRQLRDTFILLLTQIEGCVLNGSKEERVANNVNVSITGIDAEFAVISLDEKGIACATKSACGKATGDGSAVIEVLTGDHARALSSLRFTLGEGTTNEELSIVASALGEHVAETRGALHRLTKS